MSGGGQTTVQQTSSGPPAYLQPYLQYGAQQAKDIYNSSQPAYFPGSTVAAQSPATRAAISGTTARAINGSSLNNASAGYLGGVLNGNYLKPGNPYQDALNKSIADSVIPNVDAQFSLAGRYGSPAQAASLTSALADAIAPSVYGNYQQERGNQQAAAGMAPNQAAQDYADLGQLAAAGHQQDQYGQSLIDANINRWNYDQNLQANKLAQMMALLSGGNFGTQGTSTTTAPGDGLGGLGGFLGGLLGL
jgi:hypothetical protein